MGSGVALWLPTVELPIGECLRHAVQKIGGLQADLKHSSEDQGALIRSLQRPSRQRDAVASWVSLR